MKELELLVIEKMTGLDKEKIGKIYNNEVVDGYDLNILLVLAIISFVIQVAPIIINWWKNRKAMARINTYFIVRKQMKERGIENISAIKLSNAIYDTIVENPKLVEEYNA